MAIDFATLQPAQASKPQMAAPRHVPAPAVDYNPLNDLPGIAQPFIDSSTAFAHHVMGTAHGLAQFVQHGIGAGVDAIGKVTGNQDSPLVRGVHDWVASDDAGLRQREAEYQRTQPNNLPTYFGAVGGEILPVAAADQALLQGGKLAAKVLPDAAPKFIANAVNRAAQGALVAASQPVTSGDYGTTKAKQMAISGAGAAVIPALVGKLMEKGGNVASTIGAQINPAKSVGSAMAELAGVEPDAIPALPSAPEPQMTSPAMRQAAANVPQIEPAGAVALPALAPGTPPMVSPPSPQGTAVPDLSRALTQAPEAAATAEPAFAQPRTVSQLAQALREAKDPVPGVKLSTAHALGPILGPNNVPIVQLATAFENTPAGKVAFEQRAIENNAKRLEYLSPFKSTAEDLSQMIKDRSTWAKSLMGSVDGQGRYQPGAFTEPVDPTPVLDHIADLKRTSFNSDPVIKRALTSLETEISSAADTTEPGGVMVRPDLMDGIRQHLRSIIADNASNGAVSSKQEASLQPLASTIVHSIEAANPGYRDYLGTYAAKSQPINTVEAAQALLSADAGGALSGGVNAAGDPVLTLPKINSVRLKADKTEYPLSPDFLKALDDVHQSLQTASQSIPVRGSPTLYNQNVNDQLNDALTGRLGIFDSPTAKTLAGAAGAAAGSIAPGLGTIGGAGAALVGLPKLSAMGGGRLQSAYLDALMNPETMAYALEHAPAQSGPSFLDSLNQLPVLRTQ